MLSKVCLSWCYITTLVLGDLVDIISKTVSFVYLAIWDTEGSTLEQGPEETASLPPWGMDKVCVQYTLSRSYL